MPRFAQSTVEPVLANMGSSREEYKMSPNVSYQQDVQYVFKPTSWILSSMGIWPIVFRRIGKHISKFVFVLYNSALLFTTIPCILHIIYDQKDLHIKLKLCGLLGFCFIALTKYFILMIRQSKIQSCIQQVKNDWWQVKFKSDREWMLKYAGMGRKLSLISMSAMYSAGFIYHLILPFCTEHKIGNQTIRPLVYPTYSKFGQSQISPIYEIVYMAHCVCGYTTSSITAGTCGLAAIFATHACGQIQVIISRLQDVLNGRNFEYIPNIPQRIAAIVKGHVQVMKYAAIVEEVLQEVCFVEFTSSLCTICLLEYYCILDWQADDSFGVVTHFMLFTSLCFNIYILCYISELLMKKSSQIGIICYLINWYEMPPSSNRDLILIIAMSARPLKISAGRMVDLSLTTFGNVMKTTLAYLSFLRALVM